jgi:hypothetical protein
LKVKSRALPAQQSVFKSGQNSIAGEPDGAQQHNAGEQLTGAK